MVYPKSSGNGATKKRTEQLLMRQVARGIENTSCYHEKLMKMTMVGGASRSSPPIIDHELGLSWWMVRIDHENTKIAQNTW